MYQVPCERLIPWPWPPQCSACPSHTLQFDTTTVKSTMRLLLLLSTLTKLCLAKDNSIVNVGSTNQNIRGRHNEINKLTMVATPGDSNSVDGINVRSWNGDSSNSSTDESMTKITIMYRDSIHIGGDDGSAITVEHHHSSHHQGHGQSPHHDNNDPSKSSASHEKDGRSSHSFDFYVYSMSYQPEFCRENNEKYAGCHAFNESWEGQLTIHGLWPNNNDGTYPSTCTDEQLDVSLLQTVYDSLANKWPNIKALSTSSPEHDAFWAHEWSKHGTCSGLSQLDYFTAALGLLVPTPAVVKERYGSGTGEVTRQELVEGYTYHRYDNAESSVGGVRGNDDISSAVILVCKSDYLSEVRVCYEKKANEGDVDGEVGGVGDRMQCPDSVMKEDTCGNTIKIASFVGMAADTVVAMPV